jgi:carboxymethylenebutenolidase
VRSLTDLADPRAVTSRGVPVLLAEPPGAARRPCVILLHERYGLVRHTQELAHRLAAEGYLVAAPDLFHAVPDQDALHRGEVKVASDDVATLADLESVVAVLYGAAQDREWETHARFPVGLRDLIMRGRAPVLGMFGERDHAISIAHVLRLRGALEEANRSYALTVFHDAPHGWLNDTMPGRYRPAQAAAAWAELTAFLARHLSGEAPQGTVEWRFACTKRADYDFATNVRME